MYSRGFPSSELYVIKYRKEDGMVNNLSMLDGSTMESGWMTIEYFTLRCGIVLLTLKGVGTDDSPDGPWKVMRDGKRNCNAPNLRSAAISNDGSAAMLCTRESLPISHDVKRHYDPSVPLGIRVPISLAAFHSLSERSDCSSCRTTSPQIRLHKFKQPRIHVYVSTA